ncbi:MAG TPA: phage minor capsid protein [Phycisphaerae bacterium]|nr:phage minor capsid protein [Phycisphaerae bacterium]
MFDRMTPELLRFYEQAEKRLTLLLGQAGISRFSYRRTELLLQQIDSTVRALEQGQRGWSQKHLPTAYRQGVNLTAEAYRLPVLPAMTLIDRGSIEAVIARVMADTAGGLESIAPFARRMWVDTQQTIVKETQMAQLIAEGRVEGLGPKELGRRITQTLKDGASQRLKGYVPEGLRGNLERAARGEFITIKGRHYNMKKYGELVAQTATRQAATEGAIAETLVLGGDLMQLTVHSGACPVCLPWQGKIFSISGRTPGFPLLTNERRAPLHPRCRHATIGVDADILEERGWMGGLRDFSASDRAVDSAQAWGKFVGASPATLGAA